MRTGVGFSCALALAALCAWGCDTGDVESPISTGGTGGGTGYAGVGESCDEGRPCRPGLACNAGTCEIAGTQGEGSSCVISGECAAALQCVGGICTPEGSGEDGSSCTSDADCKKGLHCVLSGFAAQCAPEGDKDVGGACTTTNDCYGGLTCLDGACAVPPPGSPSFGISHFAGVSCDEPSTGDVRAYFEVPGAAGAEEGDFFRLPFPNDVRISGGKLDLTGFPTPGAGLLGFDPVQIYADALAQNESAWGTYPTVIFRFSGPLDYSSIQGGAGKSPINWIDITPGLPSTEPKSYGAYWYASSGGTKYVCHNWLGVRRPQGAPLTPGHTYAVWITTDVVGESGAPVQRAPNFAAMLAQNPPSDAKLAAAHAAFAPLRAHLSSNGIPADTILNATVISVADVRSTMADLAAGVQADAAPTAKSWVKCDGSQASPCPQAEGERACGSPVAEYDEFHALVTLPIFQQGTAPYLAPDDGGDVASTPVRHEDVCLALTVPKGSAMPAGGWPLVVFAHGTGGSFRSHVRPEIAGALSDAATPAGNVRFAVLGIDQVQHGPRRGASDKSPNDLFFNFANPSAARGNPLQGAADQVALARFAVALDATVGSDAIKIDPTQVVFYGHSQGATHGSLALPYADTYRGAVLSGNGASLLDALLTKTQPVNIAGAVPFVLGDLAAGGSLNGGDMHPALTLLQHWIDRGDPLNFARAIAAEPPTGQVAKHVFSTYGLGDHYSPPKTMATFVLAARMDLAQSHASVVTPDAIGNLTPKTAPLSGNLMTAGNPITAGARQYSAPSGVDGHFVAFDVPGATADVARFLGMAASGAVPEIGP